MKFVSIYDAKTNLSKYLDKVNTSHEIIVICKNGVPVGQLTSYKAPKYRKLGLLKGKMIISDNFDADLPGDIMEYYK